MDLSIIRERMGQLDTFKNENKVAKEALKNELENDTDYLAALEELKAVKDKVNRIKDALWAKGETQKLINDIKENREELTTIEEILSVELAEYCNEKKVDEITDHDGEVRKIKIVAKLLPKSKHEDRDYEGKYMSKVEPNLE